MTLLCYLDDILQYSRQWSALMGLDITQHTSQGNMGSDLKKGGPLVYNTCRHLQRPPCSVFSILQVPGFNWIMMQQYEYRQRQSVETSSSNYQHSVDDHHPGLSDSMYDTCQDGREDRHTCNNQNKSLLDNQHGQPSAQVESVTTEMMSHTPPERWSEAGDASELKQGGIGLP